MTYTYDIQENNAALNQASGMYTEYAEYYDAFYSLKNYKAEATFLHELLSENKCKTVLDVGCGTGTHMSYLQSLGYVCSGIDFNNDMLKVAHKKGITQVQQADMRDFDLRKTFDAVVSLFAVFNHALTEEDALQTLQSIKKHMHKESVLILDLYNARSCGQKNEVRNGITRSMKWSFDPVTSISTSYVTFSSAHFIHESQLLLKIYSLEMLACVLTKSGFSSFTFYHNYTRDSGTALSKNLLVVARL